MADDRLTSTTVDTTDPIPAATVVVLRDGADGIEVLMVRRDANLAFAGGMWVFPGGRVDPADRAGLRADDHLGAAARAAVREAQEEAGLGLDVAELVWFSHWTPPPISRKRFGTWFFAVLAPDDADDMIVVDGAEITTHEWMRPADAQARRNAGDIDLAPPTWITLSRLDEHDSVAALLVAFRSTDAEYFETRFASVPDGGVALYHGDVAYDDEGQTAITGEIQGDPLRPGPRHRLWMLPEAWRYERDA